MLSVSLMPLLGVALAGIVAAPTAQPTPRPPAQRLRTPLPLDAQPRSSQLRQAARIGLSTPAVSSKDADEPASAFWAQAPELVRAARQLWALMTHPVNILLAWLADRATRVTRREPARPPTAQ